MTMDAVTIETLPTTKSLISTKVPESTDITKEKDDDILFVDEIDEDDEIRLRLSDDEEVEQDNTLGQTESQQASLQLKRNDLEFDVHIAVTSEETLKTHHKDLIIKQEIHGTDTLTLIQNEHTENILNEKLVNEICNINDEQSTMSGSEKVPSLMKNSRKFWSNNFDKRWKGINSPRGRQNFYHRNTNDCYNQHYSEKEKLNNRHNFNHHNNHNNHNKLRNNTGGSYNNQSGNNSTKEIKKEQIDESSPLKHNISTSKNPNETNDLIQENGISDDIQSKKKDLSIQNEKINDIETKYTETDCSEIKDGQISSEEKLSDLKVCKENDDDDSNKDIVVNKDANEKEKLIDNNLNDGDTLSITKECYVSMTESQKENYKSKSEETSEEIGNNFNCDTTEKQVCINTNSISNNVDLELKENSSEKNSELSSEKLIKIANVTSHDENMLENKCQNSIEVDINNVNLCIHTKKNNNSDQISVSGIAKDIIIELSANASKNLSENFQTEIKVDGQKFISETKQQIHDARNETNDTKLTENINMSENDNHCSLDKSMIICEMEVSEIELIDKNNSLTVTNGENNEIMDIVTDTETSQSILIDVKGVKNSDLNDSKLLLDVNETNSLETLSLLNDKNDNLQAKEVFNKIDNETKENQKPKELKNAEESNKINSIESNEEEKISNVIEEVDLVDDEPETETDFISNNNQIETLNIKVDVPSNTAIINKDSSQTVPISTADNNKVEESNEDGRAVVHKRRRRKRLSNIAYLEIAANEIQTDEFFNSVKMLIENGVRQKRRSARNAEEMIRKEILKNDEDEEDSSDESGKLVPVNYKKANYAQPLSPPSLKRSLDDTDSISESVTLKRIKSSGDNATTTISQAQEKKEHILKSKESIAETNELVRKISQEDIRGKLKKLKQEELEALLLQKIVECITIRGEMGKLREQARVSKRNQEATRSKCQQLQKQVEGFDMVLKRISYDKNSNNDKFAPPIKINRSVGLQVNFLSDHGIHNLKQIQALKTSTGITGTNPNVTAKTTLAIATAATTQDNRSLTQSPRKMLKVRSPRRPEVTAPALVQGSSGSSTTATVNGTHATPNPLVMNKSIDQSPKRTITLQNSNNIVQLMPPGQQQQTAVVVNSNIVNTSNRPAATLTIQRSNNSVINKASDLIDLTDEEDKSKIITPLTTGITTRFPRVLQAVPASVALTNSNNLRLVQAGGQGSPTTIVNNMNTPRLAYVMQGGVSGVPTRQLVLTSSNTIRPVTSVSTRNISTISYKQGVPTLTNGTVRVLTTQAPTTNLQHPAPLPESPIPESNPLWKSPPPAPSLKISKVASGIVLSWNMSLTDKFAEIVSYQLYAYQEVAGTSPSASLWKKVGDVRALPLPMACTLTQFTEGNNYYFAVRAVDIHSRFGQYSKPGNISL